MHPLWLSMTHKKFAKYEASYVYIYYKLTKETVYKKAQSIGKSCHGEKIAFTLYLLIYERIIIKKLE